MINYRIFSSAIYYPIAGNFKTILKLCYILKVLHELLHFTQLIIIILSYLTSLDSSKRI